MLTITFNVKNDGNHNSFAWSVKLFPDHNMSKEVLVKWAYDIETAYNQDGSRRMHISIEESSSKVVKA